MKLILIDGGPASGKNTLGSLLVAKFQKQNQKAILLDLDTYVEKLNPTWIWKDKEKELDDQKLARENYLLDINKYLEQDYIIIAIGERFLTKDDVIGYKSKIKSNYPVYLFHLSPPFKLRKQRLDERGPHSLIDLEKDQQERDANPSWPGYIYQNINTVEIDTEKLFVLINNNQGILDTNLF